MFNDLAWLQFLHMWVGAFMLVGLVVSGVYAAGHAARPHRSATTAWASPCRSRSPASAASLQPLIGHVLGLQVGGMQPTKLAAWELNPVTASMGLRRNKLGGVLIDGRCPVGAAPSRRSAHGSPRGSWDAPVPGLDTVPQIGLGRRSTSRTGLSN